MSEQEPSVEELAPANSEITVQRVLHHDKIDGASYKSFYSLLRGIPPTDPILLELSTEGGDPTVTNLWVETIQVRSTAVLVLCLNEICSAGILFLGISGSTKLCYPSTIFMTHQHSAGYPKTGPGSLVEWELTVNRQCNLGMQRVQIEAGLSDEETQMMKCSYDMYFDAFDALSMGKYGLIDGIIIKQVRLRSYYVWTRVGYKLFNFPQDNLSNSPVLTEEQIKEAGLPKVNFTLAEPTCFARYKARQANK